MLIDRELEQSAAQLAHFRQASDQHQTTLNQMLEKYAALMEDYKRLSSDFEEERHSRERYKQLAKGGERNPFVLVLIDGDGYVFDDDLVSSGAEGGQRAARLLDDAVKRSMREKGLDHCRVMVRVYANLVGLSKALAKAGLAGKEKRSLAPFAASFTRSNDLFDFVDAGELKENADFKIRAIFRQFAENNQCKHIYFAGCHDVGYINELTPYAANRGHITLVGHSLFHPQFNRLGIRIEQFPNLFRSTPLSAEQATLAFQAAAAPIKPTHTQIVASNNNEKTKPCVFFSSGKCKYGENCKFLHVKQAPSDSIRGSLDDIKNWRAEPSRTTPGMPFHMGNLTKNDNDFMSGHTAPSIENHGGGSIIGGALDPMQNQINFATSLPQLSEIPPGKIPVNADEQRLDTYIPQPSPADYDEFKSRTSKKKLCNNYHVAGNCPNTEFCGYDHMQVNVGVLNALKQVVYGNPCPRRGSCRRTACLSGHVCQRVDCSYRGGKVYCKFPRWMHAMDTNVAKFVDGELPAIKDARGGPTGTIETGVSTPAETAALVGVKSVASTPSGPTHQTQEDDGVNIAQETTATQDRRDASPSQIAYANGTTDGLQSARSASSAANTTADDNSWGTVRPSTGIAPVSDGWDAVRPTMIAEPSDWDTPRPTIASFADEWQAERDQGALLNLSDDPRYG